MILLSVCLYNWKELSISVSLSLRPLKACQDVLDSGDMVPALRLLARLTLEDVRHLAEKEQLFL